MRAERDKEDEEDKGDKEDKEDKGDKEDKEEVFVTPTRIPITTNNQQLTTNN